MKFTVDMAELRQKISFARHGMGSSKTDLSVNLMKFDVGATSTYVFAANKENFCGTKMKTSNSEGKGTFTVLGAKMERLVAQVQAEQVHFEIDDENLEVQAGFLTVNFELFDGALLQTIQTQNANPKFISPEHAVPREALDEALTCAKSCTTTASIRPDVTHCEVRKGRLLSSDGRKILIYSHDNFPEKMVLKIPATSLGNVAQAVRGMEPDVCTVAEAENYYYVMANRGEYVVAVRKVERIFPSVEDQILKAPDPSDEVSVDKHVMEAMLRGVALGLPSDEVKVEITVDGKEGEAYLEIGATNSLGRRSHERASCGRKKETQIKFPVSFKHLLDTMSVFKGDTVVDMVILIELNLLMVRDSTEAREVMTVIPFRTDQQIEKERAEVEATKVVEKADKEDEEGDQGELAAAVVETEDESIPETESTADEEILAEL